MRYLKSIEWLFQQIPIQKETFAISSGLGIIVDFLIKRWSSDFILFPLIFALIIINTISGVRRTLRENTFNKSILRTKTVDKMIGYLLWLVSLYILGMCLSVAAEDADNLLIPKEWVKLAIHYPITLSYFFIAGVEINSTRQNINSGGVQTPKFISDKIEEFIDSGKVKPNA